MLFLQPLLLWFLAAAAIPVVIHLLNRRRHKTVQWAAMQFLLKATRESRGKKRLRHILILTCRALGIAALATAAALPVVSSLFGFGSGKPELVVLLFDRSASMETNPESGTIPRRRLALQRVRDAFEELGGTRLVIIDSASGAPQEVPSPSVIETLSITDATDTRADLPELLATAGEFLTENPGRAEVWIASDLQSTAWRPEDDRWNSATAALASLPQPPQIRVLSLGGDPAANQSVRILSSRRSGDSLVLDLELSRGTEIAAPLNLPLTTSIDGTRSTESVTLAGQQLRLQKRVPIPADARRGRGWVSIPGDGNPRDNVAYFAYGPSTPARSLVVSPPGEAADFLTLAAAPGGFDAQSAERLDPAALTQPFTTDLASLVWAAPLPTGAIAAEIERFIEAGGQAVFLPPAADSEASFLGLTWSPVAVARTEQFFILDSWDRNDGLLRDGIDGTAVPGDRLRAIKRRTPLGEASILARWDDTEPFLVRRVIGRGTAWFLGTLPDYTWSNLADGDVLLPAIQRAVQTGVERFDAGFLATLGAAETRPRPGETRRRLDAYESTSDADPAHLAGVYRFGDRVLAINRPAEEDITDILEPAALPPLFEGLRFSLFDDTSGSANENLSRGVWQSFLIAMLLFLLAEALLCLPKKSTAPTATPSPLARPGT